MIKFLTKLVDLHLLLLLITDSLLLTWSSLASFPWLFESATSSLSAALKPFLGRCNCRFWFSIPPVLKSYRKVTQGTFCTEGEGQEKDKWLRTQNPTKFDNTALNSTFLLNNTWFQEEKQSFSHWVNLSKRLQNINFVELLTNRICDKFSISAYEVFPKHNYRWLITSWASVSNNGEGWFRLTEIYPENT